MYISVPFFAHLRKRRSNLLFSQKLRSMPASLSSPSFLCSNPFARQGESVPHICIHTTHAFWFERVAYIQYIRECGCVCFKCPAYTTHSLDARGNEGAAAAMTNDAASGPARSEGVRSHFAPEEKEEEEGGEGYLAPGPAIKSEGWRGKKRGGSRRP